MSDKICFLLTYFSECDILSRSIHELQMEIFHCFLWSILNQSSVDGHLGCFHVLAIGNSAAMRCMYLFELEFLSFLDICPGVGLLDNKVTLFLVFQGNPILFSIAAAPIYIPTNSVGRFLFLHTLSNIYYL